jgi:hypothetical protein
MKQLSLTRVIVRRIVDDWKLLLTVFIGIVIATVIGAATPIYLNSLDQLSFNAALDRIEEPKIDILGAEVVASRQSIDAADKVITDAIAEHISEVYAGHERFIKSNVAIVGTPNLPLPEGNGEGVLVSTGYLQHLSNLPRYAEFIEGRVAAGAVSSSAFGAKIEAVVTSQMAQRYDLKIDDDVFLSSELISQRVAPGEAADGEDTDLDEALAAVPPPVSAGPPSLTVTIVGIFDPLDPDDRVWGRERQALEPPAIDTPAPFLTQQRPGETPLVMFTDERAMRIALQDLIEETTFLGQETYVKGAPMLVDTPSAELPVSAGQGIIIRLGFLTSLTNIVDHIVFEQGQMPGTEIGRGPRGPIIEAMAIRGISSRTEAEIGDVFEFSPELGQREIITARITGFFEEDDKESEYWKAAGIVLSLNPQQQDTPFLVVSDDGLSTVPVVVQPEVLAQVLADTYPGAIVRPQWVVSIDPEKLKEWTAAQARERFSAFSDAITTELPDARPGTEFVENLTQSGELRNFFSKIPMLLLLTVILLTVLFFLGILVSYLTLSRENDSSLLKTLGATIIQLTRIYTTEGLVMVVVAVIVAPLLAYGMVAVSGVLPFFEEMNSGNLMPVRLSPTPFIISLAVGLLCLAIFVVPNVLSAQGGVLVRRLQASRPSDLPFLQRYNIDIAILVLGGLIFWELQKRGQFVSSGLFEKTEINEALLVAPVLFLIVVTLVFMRFFPMIVRYVSGESIKIVNLLAVASTVTAAVGVYWRERGNETTDWLVPIACAGGVLLAYWLTRRNWDNRRGRFIGFAVQAMLVVGFILLRLLASGDFLVLPTVGLMAVVPAQIVFMLFVGISRVTPVWLEIGLFHMSRNPMQYTWLILLLVLATGLGILATTVGGTLERSQIERVLFEEGADLRVTASLLATGGVPEVYRKSQELDDVENVVIGYRERAQTGGSSVEVLAVDTERFADVAWYRDDFSDSSLAEVMEKIKPEESTGRIKLPDGANGIGMWIKPDPFIPELDLYVQLEDESGVLQTVFLNRLRNDDWQFVIGNIPDDISPPWSLASIQMFEPGSDNQAGLSGVPVTSGTLYIDDIIATVGFENEEVVLDDFEGDELLWEPILTTAASTENATITTTEVRNGSRAVAYSFSGQTSEGLRGFYPTASPGPIPAVISSSLVRDGRNIGDTFITRVDHRWIPMKVVEIVDFFPTHNPSQGGLVITDLTSLVERSNVLLEHLKIRPVDLYYDLKPGSHERVGEAILEILGPQGGSVRDGQGRLEALQINPFVAAGWKPMTILSPLIAVFAAAVGYVTYLLLFAKRSGPEIGSLRTLGLSRRQLLSLLGFEHLAVAAIGIGLGTWAGFQMSRLTISPLAITETGDPIAPPFILTTDWPIMGTTYVALGLLFIGALIILNRGVGQLDLRAISRFGE